jgi:hypothetical protein
MKTRFNITRGLTEKGGGRVTSFTWVQQGHNMAHLEASREHSVFD